MIFPDLFIFLLEATSSHRRRKDLSYPKRRFAHFYAANIWNWGTNQITIISLLSLFSCCLWAIQMLIIYIFQTNSLLPGYAALFKHPNDELNYCCYIIPGNPNVIKIPLFLKHSPTYLSLAIAHEACTTAYVLSR